MTTRLRPQIKWHYDLDYTGPRCFDPRTAVSRQIGWDRIKISGYPDHTIYSAPEPDNFTHAILDNRCHFIPNVNHQVWYWWDHPEAWCSIFVTEHENFLQFIENKSLFAWCHIQNARPFRTRISRINYERHRNWRKTVCNDLTLEERLHDQGFFSALIERGAPEDLIRSHAGWYTPGQYAEDLQEEDKEPVE